MNSALFVELSREVWAMEPLALEALLAKVADLSSKAGLGLMIEKDLAARMGSTVEERRVGHAPLVIGFEEDSPKKSRMAIKGGVATIPISGVLMKSVPKIFRWFGIEATSYRDIENDLAEAMGDESVEAITLAVDSPGGQVSGVKEAADAIYAAAQRKPVTARIEDIGASGAYWLASQAQRVTASRNAIVGSIGVYSAYVDSSGAAEKDGYKIHVVSSGPHKGMGIPGAKITEEQLEAMQEVIDGMAANFVGDVARGRGRTEEKVKEWASGRVWISSDAASLGLLDGISDNSGTSRAGVPPAASIEPRKEEETMADLTKAAAGVDAQAATDKAVADVRTAERTRLQDLKAAFPKDQAFAFEQFEKGASVSEAKIAYCDVTMARNEKLEKENAELKTKPAAAAEPVKPSSSRGAPAVVAGEEPSAVTEEGFVARAKKLAEEKGWTLRRALSYIANTEPGVYDRHLQSVGAGAILERRRQVDALAAKERGR
jgi:signal peptide peptidase SppA